jgi:hypothetical protein
MSDYMGPIVEASNHVSHAKSLKKVGAIGNAASSLAEMIETIEPAVLFSWTSYGRTPTA